MRSYEEVPKIKLPSGVEPKISDSTIRDGSQMPGLIMSKKQKLTIFEYLHKIGIEKLECFLYNERDRDVAREMLDRGYECPEVTGWSRASPQDIDLILSMDGIEETGILMSVSDVHIFDKIGFKSKEEAREKYLNALQYAVDHGLRTRCHLEDNTRADIKNFVLPLVKDILEIDKNTIIRVCDTVGMGIPFPESDLPFSIPKIIKELKNIGVKEIETHIHDDFGLGTPNSLAGYWYGANWSSLTFLGIGERAGNTELEKVLIFLALRVEGFEKYDLSSITEFANFMEEELHLHVPRNKAVVGKNIFTHESGIHTAGILKNPFTYEPFPPEVVGGTRQLLIGDTSGTDVIRHKVEELLGEMMHIEVKIDKKDHRIKAIHREINKLYDEEGRRSCISDDEMKEYIRKYFGVSEKIEGPEEKNYT